MAAVTDTTATSKRTTRAKDRTTGDEGAAEPSGRRDPAPEAAAPPHPQPVDSPPTAGPLGRWIRRPLWWLPLAVFVGVLLYGSRLQDVWNDEKEYGRGDPLPAVVQEGYDGGEDIPIVYENPDFGPIETSVVLSRWHTGSRPEPGDAIGVRASRNNPFSARLPGHDPARPPIWLPLAFTVPFLIAGGRRWWTARRARRLLDRAASTSASDSASGDGARELLGRLRPRRRRDQTVVLDLFPIDAGPDRRPVCSVPLVSSLGLPVGGAVFPVEVCGRPRRFGRVVARVADGVMWPRRRALVLPRWLTAAETGAGAGPMRRGDEVAAAPPRLDQRRLRPPKDVWPSPGGRVLLAAVLLAAGVTIAVLGTLTIAREADQAQDLPEGTVEVPAQVVDARNDGLVEVAFQLPDGDDEQRALVPVPNAAAWPEGLPLLVVVDPDAPFHAQLPPGPYRSAEPAIWTWLPALAAGLWLVRTIRWKRAVERTAADERWYLVGVDRLDDFTFRVWHPGATMGSCLVTLPRSNEQPPEAVARTLIRSRPVYAASAPAPGERLVLRFGSAVMATTTAAAVRDRPWRRRWRALSRWLVRTRRDPLVRTTP